MSGKAKSEQKAGRAGHSEANLGQREAALEKASKAQMRHMEGGRAAQLAQRQKAEVSGKRGKATGKATRHH
jgi:hypothetical protein